MLIGFLSIYIYRYFFHFIDMSRSSRIFHDPLVCATPSPLKYRNSSTDIIHSIAKEDVTERKNSPLPSTPSNDHPQNASTVSKEPKLLVPQPTKPVFYLFSDQYYHSMDYSGLLMLTIVSCITFFACPATLITGSQTTVTMHHVFYSGWVTAVATGVGVFPFFFLREPSQFYTGVSNAIAAGMMISASVSLISEAMVYRSEQSQLLDYFAVLGKFES